MIPDPKDEHCLGLVRLTNKTGELIAIYYALQWILSFSSPGSTDPRNFDLISASEYCDLHFADNLDTVAATRKLSFGFGVVLLMMCRRTTAIPQGGPRPTPAPQPLKPSGLQQPALQPEGGFSGSFLRTPVAFCPPARRPRDPDLLERPSITPSSRTHLSVPSFPDPRTQCIYFPSQ